MIGTTLSHYKILKKIGEGGMGEVYEALDTQLERRVALKVLAAEVASDPELIERFESEAKAVAALNHPNIVTLYSVEESEGVRFLTMELIEGRSLKQVIAEGGLPFDGILELAIPLARALARVHRSSITHRDLKPANIMINDGGAVKILDFGLAKLRPDVPETESSEAATEFRTEAGRVMGTPSYMSPEQLQGRPVDTRSDLFSLGIILYEMATGAHPFKRGTAAEVMSSILRDVPKAPETLRPGLPSALSSAIQHCLEKDPERRTQSAEDLERDLEGASASPTIRLTPRLVGLALVAVTALAVVGWLLGRNDDATAREIRSIAVLPFSNLTGDPEKAYFVDGVHEALITDLAGIASLRVISRTSVMRYRDAQLPMGEIADELDVQGLVEGSVLLADNRVRITAQLIHGPTDEHLWAKQYDRELTDILGLLSEVSQSIADEVRVAIAPPAVTTPVDPKAYETYLRGRHAFNQMMPGDFGNALAFFEESIEIDPEFAPAWAGAGAVHFSMAFLGAAPTDQAMPRAKASAHKAIALDAELGEAHTVAGVVNLYFDWDWPAAASELEKALALAPNDAFTRHGYADYLTVMGRAEEGLEQVFLGRSYDPMSPLANIPVFGHLFALGRYDEMMAELQQARELFPRIALFTEWTGDTLWQQGRYEEALAEYRVAWGAESPVAIAMETALSQSGPSAGIRARAELAEAEPRADPVVLAGLWAGAGEPEAAFEWLEEAYRQRSPRILHIAIWPEYQSLRSDPRFDDLLRRIGFPE